MTTYSDPGPIADVIGAAGRIEHTTINAIRDRLVRRFNNATERDAEITGPVEGMLCHIAGAGFQQYLAGGWRSFIPYDSAVSTAGDVSAGSTSYANVDTSLDLVLPAIAGDIIEVGISALWDNQASQGNMAVRSVTRAADDVGPAGTAGIAGWTGPTGVSMPIGASFQYAAVSGDLASGVITLRLRFKVAAAGSKTLHRAADFPLAWHAKNLGQ
jgi:hypothetical protein